MFNDKTIFNDFCAKQPFSQSIDHFAGNIWGGHYPAEMEMELREEAIYRERLACSIQNNKTREAAREWLKQHA
jgi:hypothetical protein